MPVRVVLNNVARCGSEAEVLQAIQRRNARVRPALGSERAVTLVLSLSPRGAAFHGELQVRTEDGSSTSRSVEGSTCQAVIGALSLTAALALESASSSGSTLASSDVSSAPSGSSGSTSGASNPPSGSTPSAVAPEAGAATKVATPSAVSPAAGVAESPRPGGSSSSRSRLAVQLGAHAALGQPVTPHVNAGGAVLGRARLERSGPFSPSVTLSMQHTRSQLLGSLSDSEMRVTGLSVAPCPLSLRPTSRVRLEPCLLVTGAELMAVGRELERPTSAVRSWWGIGAMARLSLAVTHGLAFELEGGALVPLVERRFVALPSGRELGRTPTVAPLANAGVSYEL